MDYIFGGCEVGLQIAVDFTASNGRNLNGGSLHDFNEARNQYIPAIRAVGNILQNYDTDQKFPAYGFGACIPPVQSVSHLFAMNGKIFDPEVPGIEGVIAAYKNTVQKVQFHGPTYFAHFLNQVNGYCAAKSLEESQFN